MPQTLLREKHLDGHHRVTFVELFFDLVFVFAVTQISHALIHNFSFGGGVRALLLMVGVWWIWIFTSWVTNWLDPEQIPVRFLLFALMLGGLFLSASIPEAFEHRGLSFAIAFSTMQVGRSLFTLWAMRGDRSMVQNFQRITLWLVVSACFWLAGAVLHDSLRLTLWAIALGIEFCGPVAYFYVPGLGASSTSDWDVEGGHMAERCSAFILIALGESITVIGATFAELEWTGTTIAAFVTAFVASIAMWWLYFDVSVEAGSERISKSDDPGALARLAYTYFHLPIVAAIVLAAVGDEFLLHHPTGHADGEMTLAIVGSSALYLFGNLLFKRAVLNRWAWTHVGGIVALTILAAFAESMTPLMLSMLATLVLVVIASVERHAYCTDEVGD